MTMQPIKFIGSGYIRTVYGGDLWLLPLCQFVVGVYQSRAHRRLERSPQSMVNTFYA